MWRKLATLALSLLIPAAVACGPRVSDDSQAASAAERRALPAAAVSARPAPAAPAPSAPVVAATPTVVFLGDSLTAGLGLDESQAYPALLGRELAAAGHPVRVVNAGVSGDTTAGGLARLDWLLKQRPDVLVVALGGNDGLRGLPVEAAEGNLREIVRRAKAAGARVLLLGMQMPPNYGPDYTSRFAGMYPKIAKEFDVDLVPFMLQGVGGIRRLNQPDGIHPTPEGQEIVAKTVLPYLEKVLEKGS